MTDPNRRRFLTQTVVAATATSAAGGTLAVTAGPAQAHARSAGSGFGPVTVGESDPRYEDLVLRGKNRRFTTRPESFQVVTTTDQVVRVVQNAVRARKRVVARSGGHCFENFVGGSGAEVVIDLAEMDTVRYDADRRAFEVGAGAQLADVYRTLYYGWGVTVPGGASATVAFGGHVVGGGFGQLSRRHGISSDHLYAVEVVVVDRAGHARAVVATREADDPHRELWWAHTGGGGGNFGIITRYWFRSPGATGNDPGRLLPRPPGSVLASTVMFPREGLDKAAFRTLVRNHGRWHEEHSGPDSPYRGLFSGLVLLGNQHQDDQGMAAIAFTHLDATLPGAEKLLQDHIDALTDGVGAEPYVLPTEQLPWFSSVEMLAANQDAEQGRQKIKSAYLRRAYDDAQIDVLFERLTGLDHSHDTASVSLQGYGGRANLPESGDTATAQRDSVIRALYMNTWQDPEKDGDNVDWMRRLYADVYAGTGGVPVPGGQGDGCFLNFPDIDTADPEWNTSGVPWHQLYYKDNYRRLQAVKTAYDPRDIFHHALSIRPAGD